MFHRHGDRTAKIFPPTNLTDLGYAEVYQSGTYYRSRYIEPTSPYHIQGINTDLVLLRQIQASAPIDNVLQNSATGFFQALYPPVGPQLDTEALANGTVVTSPLNGYQLIPVEIVSSGSGSEDNSWLQSSSSCYKAEVKSNEFFESNEFLTLDNKTSSFYASLDAVVKPAFNSTETTFENAYESKFSVPGLTVTVVTDVWQSSIGLMSAGFTTPPSHTAVKLPMKSSCSSPVSPTPTNGVSLTTLPNPFAP